MVKLRIQRTTTGVRRFNGKYYVRVFSGTENNAQTLKNNLHGKGVQALVIKSGKKKVTWQVWRRKPKPGEKLYARYNY